MNILHVSASDIKGGASRAGYRIHRSLVENGNLHELQSRMRVISQLSDDPTVIGGPPARQTLLWRKLQPRMAQQVQRNNPNYDRSLHSIAWPSTGLGRELLQRHHQGECDLLHLHWLGDSTLSIEEISRLRMPRVWTLHDQWAFCGTEHYTSLPLTGEYARMDERFAVGYSEASRPQHETGPDINRRTWLRKQRAWRRPIHIVCPSAWLADCARRSSLMATWPITVIPHPIDLDVWAPVHSYQARHLLQLPQDRLLVLFGADRGTAYPRKGADLLLEAMQRLRAQVADSPLQEIELVVFGQGCPANPLDLGLNIRYIGRLEDDISLRLLYSAADVMVVPSRQEAFGLTGSEAQACGTPVVAFRTGGLVDIVDDYTTGVLAEPFNAASLAAAIGWVLDDSRRRIEMRAAARQRAERLWDSDQIALKYAQVYRDTTLVNA